MLDKAAAQISEETRKEAVKANAEDVKLARAFEAMIATEGWKLFEQLLQKKVEESGTILMEPISDGQSLRQEYQKGTMYGMLWASKLPHVTITAMKELRGKPVEDE